MKIPTIFHSSADRVGWVGDLIRPGRGFGTWVDLLDSTAPLGWGLGLGVAQLTSLQRHSRGTGSALQRDPSRSSRTGSALQWDHCSTDSAFQREPSGTGSALQRGPCRTGSALQRGPGLLAPLGRGLRLGVAQLLHFRSKKNRLGRQVQRELWEMENWRRVYLAEQTR